MNAPENQGEGDKESARHYNDAQKKFVESGKVDAAAAAAGPADAAEAAELKRAEEAGKARSKGDESLESQKSA